MRRRGTTWRSAPTRRPPQGLRPLGLCALLVAVGSAALLVVGLLPPPAAEGPTAASLPPELLREALTFDADLLAAIESYRRPRRVVAVLALAISVLVPAAAARALWSGRARRILRRVAPLPGPALQAAVAVTLVVLLTAAARLPLSIWTGIVQDGRFGFRTRSVTGWFVDHAVVVGGRALAIGGLTWAVVTLVRRSPRDWPARVTLLAAAAGLAGLLLHPVLVHPLLLPTGPLPDGPHRDAVLEVLARSDVDVPVLLGEASRRTTRRNAVATGLGPTERIVLHDTLLELTPEEVAALTAHEVAHLERRDPLRGVLAPVPSIALIAALVRRRLDVHGPPDVRRLAAAGALVLALEAASTPLAAAVSRTVEHRTDVRSVVISADPEAHLRVLRAFVTDGLADPDPPRWSVLLWATHPTPTERMIAVSGPSDPAMR